MCHFNGRLLAQDEVFNVRTEKGEDQLSTSRE